MRDPQTPSFTTPFARLPHGVRAALIELLGEDATGVELIERSWRVRWHPRALATTRRNRIYLRGSIEEFARDAELVLHEYFHVLEQWRPRRLTRTRYVWEWLRRGYQQNRFEVETREYVARNLRRFRVLIAGQSPHPNPLPQAGEGVANLPQAGEGVANLPQAGEGVANLPPAAQGVADLSPSPLRGEGRGEGSS